MSISREPLALCIAFLLSIAMPACAQTDTTAFAAGKPAGGWTPCRGIDCAFGASAVQSFADGFSGGAAGNVMRGDPMRLAAAGATADGLPSLLDEDASPKTKFGGFVDGLGAFTYASPAHWSRAVGRVQVVGQGTLTNDIKWKIGGRVDVDPVYFSSHFYPDAVKRDQRVSAIWGENYLDFSAGDWNFRLGAQHIVWGEVVGLFFADVVSARDMREFLLPSFDLIRIPQAAARAEYFSGDSHVEFIWIPVPTFDRIGKPGSDFYPARLPSPTPPEVAALFADPETPARKLSNSNYGVRANTLASGWDVAAFYYRSFNTEPTFYPRFPNEESPDVGFQPRYDRIWQVGATLSKDFDTFVLRAETVYTHGQGYNSGSSLDTQSIVEHPTLAYIVSVDVPLPKDSRINLQAFQNIFLNGGGRDVAVRNDGVGISIFASTKIGNSLEPQVLWIQNFNAAGGMVRPRLNWHAARNTTVGFGVDVFTGPSAGYFGRYNNRDRVYTEVRYDF